MNTDRRQKENIVVERKQKKGKIKNERDKDRNKKHEIKTQI